MKNIFFPVIAIAFLLHLPVKAQSSGSQSEKIGLNQGLSQSTIYAITQDSSGFMWFASQEGLNRYDGYSVKVYKNNSGLSNSVSDNTVMSLLNDKKGNLWIGTMSSGLDRYDPAADKFYHYRHNENDPSSISENEIICLFEDSYGNIWTGTRRSGLNLIENETGTFRHFKQNSKDSTSISGNTIKALCEDKSGNLWIATNRGLSKLNLDELNNKSVRSTDLYFYNYKGLKGTNIKTLFIDDKNILWIGTWGEGLISWDLNKNTRRRYYNNSRVDPAASNFIQTIYETRKGDLLIATHNAGVLKFNRQTDDFDKYDENVVLSFFEDRSGILWLGTSIDGVVKQDSRRTRFRHYYNDPVNSSGLNDNFVFNIFEDKDGELWIRTYKNGLDRFDVKREKVSNYKFNTHYNSANDRVLSLCGSFDGSIWIGTQKGELYNFNKQTETFERYEDSVVSEITYLLEDSRKVLWIGNNIGQLYNFDKASGSFIPYYLERRKGKNPVSGWITSIYECSDKSLLVGTLRDGFYHFSPGVDGYKHLIGKEGEKNTINNNTVLSFYEDDSSSIWIGTFGGGLNKYNPGDGSFRYYTETAGLPNNVVYGILPDRQGNLWLSTNKGLSRFNKKNETFRNFDARDGLQGDEFNNQSYFASSSGELFFGGPNGFNSFYPESIIDNNFIPPVYITDFKVFDESLDLPQSVTSAKQIELTYAQNFFTFDFVALNFTLPEKNQYSYILEGFDKKWHNVNAENRTASYTNIDPGTYIFRVKGSNNDGVWNSKGASVILVIDPPYWATWWFKSLAVLFIAGIVIFIYNYRVSQLLKIERMRVRIASDLHDEIGSSIGSIVLRSRTLQRENALSESSKEELGRIHGTALQTASVMRDIVWFINPDFDTLDDMILRMKDTAQFLLNGINYEFIAPDEILSVKLSLDFRRNVFLCYKEILHNIAKHSKAENVLIRITINKNNLELEISDDGSGFNYDKDQQTNNNGSGLKNIHARIKNLNGRLNIISNPGKGTSVIINVKTT